MALSKLTNPSHRKTARISAVYSGVAAPFFVQINQVGWMDAFISFFCNKYSLPLAAGTKFLEQMETCSFRKGDYLLQEGERNSNFYIIRKGIWRGHCLKDGTDVSVWFATEGEALFSSMGYVENRGSLVSIEAMCDSELLGISKTKLEAFYNSSIEWANFGRRLFEQQYLSIDTWVTNGGSPWAKERYLMLLEENPELLQHVPLKHLASYLWITPQSLSRIRAEIGKTPKRE